jgi:hypothetical protein
MQEGGWSKETTRRPSNGGAARAANMREAGVDRFRSTKPFRRRRRSIEEIARRHEQRHDRVRTQDAARRIVSQLREVHQSWFALLRHGAEVSY